MGLSLFKFLQWAPKYAPFLQQSAFWQLKVIQGRSRVRLPIRPSLRLWSYLAPFLRYVELLAKIAYFSYPSLIRRPRSMFPLEFCAEVNLEETRVMGLSSSEDPAIVN